MTESNEHI